MELSDLKDRLNTIKDEVLGYHEVWVAALQSGAVAKGDSGALIEAFNCLHSVAASLPQKWQPPSSSPLRINCECSDKGCPCDGDCRELATETIFRIDMEDDTGTRMCGTCADGAHLTGLFRSTFGSVELNNAI